MIRLKMCFIGGCVFLRFCMTVKSTRGVQHLRLFACICYLAMIHEGFYRTDCMYTFIVCNTGIMLLLDAMLAMICNYLSYLGVFCDTTWLQFINAVGFGVCFTPKDAPRIFLHLSKQSELPRCQFVSVTWMGRFLVNFALFILFSGFFALEPSG